MQILRIQSSGALTTSANHTRTEVTGVLSIGATPSSNSFDKSLYQSYARNIRIYDVGETSAIFLPDGSITNSSAYVAAVAQQEQATAVGTVTTNGTILISVTSNALTGFVSNTKVVTITTTGLPVAATWAEQARTALANDSTISNLFTVSGTGADIILTRKIDDYGLANDATLNIALTAGTAVGITNAPTSTNLTAAALAQGVLVDQEDTVDAEGVDLGDMDDYTAGLQAKCIRGKGEVKDNGTSFFVPVVAGNFFIHSNNTNENCGAGSDSVVVESTAVPMEITLLIVTKKV